MNLAEWHKSLAKPNVKFSRVNLKQKDAVSAS